jgi:hypothetical protein
MGVLFWMTDYAGATEASSPLEGHWRTAETPNERNQRLQAIDEATGHLGVIRRDKARSRLSERTSPPRSLIIEVEGPKVRITSGDRRLELELGGAPIEVSGSEGKALVSAEMDGPRLIVVARRAKGRRTSTYLPNGARLSMEVTMTGTALAGPLKYVSTFARVE